MDHLTDLSRSPSRDVAGDSGRRNIRACFFLSCASARGAPHHVQNTHALFSCAGGSIETETIPGGSTTTTVSSVFFRSVVLWLRRSNTRQFAHHTHLRENHSQWWMGRTVDRRVAVCRSATTSGPLRRSDSVSQLSSCAVLFCQTRRRALFGVSRCESRPVCLPGRYVCLTLYLSFFLVLVARDDRL